MFCTTEDRYGDYNSIEDAILECKSDSNCKSIYDRGCDETGTFKLCSWNAREIRSSKGNCIYARGISGK